MTTSVKFVNSVIEKVLKTAPELHSELNETPIDFYNRFLQYVPDEDRDELDKIIKQKQNKNGLSADMLRIRTKFVQKEKTLTQTQKVESSEQSAVPKERRETQSKKPRKSKTESVTDANANANAEETSTELNEVPQEEQVQAEQETEQAITTENVGSNIADGHVFPEFEVPSKDNELAAIEHLLAVLMGTYNFEKGKRVLANRPVTERNVELEREEVRTLPRKLVTEFIELSGALQQFAEENSDGTIKVCEKGIKAVFKKLKKDADKKPDVEFPLNAKWEEFQQTQKSVFKYLSKEFLREHWKEVLTSGILKSRSIVNSKDFLVSGISKIGIMSAININITDIIPCPTAVKPAGTYKDYYWLLVNAKDSLKPSDVFNRREAITRHPRYVAVNARNQWELCKQNLVGDSELINIWKELLDSRFMFDIIMHNVHANPLIESCLNELFNESAELFKTVLRPISFVFSCSFLGPITGDLKTTLRNSQDIYAYDKYSWLHKVNNPSDNCVCDIVQVGGH